MAKSKYIETLEEQYTKKDAKSVLRYKAPDNKWRYVQTSKDANGGTPMPSGGGMTEVTWQELKDKRDNGELTAGSLYRITDYQCTTTQKNTRSAGHQFDIILLALSEDKLAEEGWAMMNESNIYDVTFADGVTKKCWIYQDDVYDNIVDCSTLLGTGAMSIGEEDYNDVILNKTNRTAICTSVSSSLHEPDLIYNYFQNSNLSAWKVWYCLDNDKSRFAWADDGDIESITDSDGVTYNRNASEDVNDLYGWTRDTDLIFTKTQTPKVGDATYDDVGASYDTPIIAISGFGRGVIYRLIDEWNNDVGYDFKNIQFVRPMTDGEYDAQGTDTWVYTLNNVDAGQGIYDASLNTIPSDNSTNNKIDSLYTFLNDKNYFVLPDVVILYGGGYNNISRSQIITILQNVVKMQGCQDCIIGNADSQFYICDTILTTESDDPTIYINNKKVLTEK